MKTDVLPRGTIGMSHNVTTLNLKVRPMAHPFDDVNFPIFVKFQKR